MTEEPARQDESSAPRIAFFIPAPNYGGAQRVTINIANGLAERGYEVDLVVAWPEGESASVLAPDVRLVNLSVPKVPGLGILAGVPYLKSYLDRAEVAVLFAGQTHANITAVLAARAAGSRPYTAVTEHLAYEHVSDPKDRVTKWMAGYVYPLADDIIAVSKGVAQSVVGHTNVEESDMTVLYNPIDIASVRASAAEGPRHKWLSDDAVEPIVSVSRLEPQKDLGTLIRAFDRVHQLRPGTRLLVVGKGSEQERLKALVRSLGIENVVDFPGYVDNPYAYMGASSVFGLSSKFEGLPTGLIEALACGCSIVATDCPYGPREILGEGEYGRLVPVGDPAAMADAILESLDEPVPAEKSISRADEFSMEAGIDRYEEYIRDVVTAEGTGEPAVTLPDQ